MPWFNVWDGLKNKMCRYLLHRYLGRFLEDKLNLEQLNVELYNGKASVRNVSLNVNALNELFESQGWCVEVTRGTIGLISVTVPWNALMTNNSTIEIFDSLICLRPVQRQNNGASMLESMWSSVSSSLQLAQECMNHTDDSHQDELEHKESIDGLEKFAETIDSVLNRIRAKCTNVVFKLEYVPKGCLHGIAVLIKINSLYYQNNDDCQQDMENKFDSKDQALTIDNKDLRNTTVNILSTYATHNIFFNDICIYTQEFKASNSNIDSSINILWGFSANRNFDEKTEKSNINDSSNKINIKNASTPIPILFVKGKQRIFLKMKQSEAVEGPKVIFDIELGDMSMIVTPRQIHLLSYFYELFYEKKNSEDNFKNVEIGLERSTAFLEQEGYYISSHMSGGLETQNVWGEINLNEGIKSSENLMKPHLKKIEFPCFVSTNSSMSSSYTATNSMRSKRAIPNGDICSDISKFNAKISKAMVLMLQADVLVEQNINTFNNPLNEESEKYMLDIAEKFFYTCFEKTFDLGKTEAFSDRNHVSLLISTMTVDGVQQRNKNVLLLNLSVCASNIYLQEVLDNISTPLIYFAKNLYCSKALNAQPELTVHIKSTTPCDAKNVYNCASSSKTEFEILLQEFVLELDVSIYDRLSAVFGYSPFKKFYKIPRKQERRAYRPELSQTYTSIEINSGKVDIKIRFPIVDARPLQDPERYPWWKQNIRADYILLCMEEMILSFRVNKLEIKASALDAFYCETPMKNTHLVKATCALDKSSMMEPKFQYPKIVIEFPNVVDLVQCENCNVQNNKVNCCCVPFSTKRICRQSGTIHSNNDVPEEPEIFILPGETKEMKKFCDTTFRTSKFRIKMDLPSVMVELNSKELYEIIYNRLNSDLFMWEPSAPIFQNLLEHPMERHVNTSLFDFSAELDMDTFYSFTNPDSNKNMDYCDLNELSTLEQNNSSENMDYNMCEFNQDKEHKGGMKGNNVTNRPPKLKKPSLCSFEITIENGMLTFIAPTKNVKDNPHPIECGKFIIKANKLYFFFVSGHNGNKNMEYLCLCLHDFEMFHCGLISADQSMYIDISADYPPYMKSTFYKTPYCLTKGKGEGCIEREMVSIVMEINKIPEQRIKRLKITTGLQKTTLRHNPAHPSQTWLCQLLEFLEIKDYPVCGYVPYGIISEMQLHMWDCAIDYRPKNFQFRSVIEIGSFNVSSNIISTEMGCTLRFVIEDCILSIAQNDLSVVYPDFEITTVPSHDLVPVLEIGLLDVSLRISAKSTERCPKLDLRAVIQDVHLRTCSDSGSALAQLISYIAKEEESFDSRDGFISTLSSLHSENEISDQQEHVNKLMAEAVQEPSNLLNKSCAISNTSAPENSIEVFYFPDEGNRPSNLFGNQNEKAKISCSRNCDINYGLDDLLISDDNILSKSIKSDVELKTLPQIKEDLGDISAISETSDENCCSKYDEYCLIAEEENSFMTNFGITNLSISDDPLRIVDNHFLVPVSKQDILKSPENLPMVEQRYTLCEMVFTWHLYGGNDFPFRDAAVNQPSNKEVFSPSKGSNSNMSEAYKHGVSYSNNDDCILFAKKPKEKPTWKTIGGVNRHQEVLVEIHLSKVRCSHDVYSEFSTHASRQVLLVNELEIRDRLQSSEINKFLYHQKFNKLPTRNIQNMIVLKALHVRPSLENHASEECSLRISLLPLRLHIDQDTLLFLVDFFTNLNDNCKNEALLSEVECKHASLSFPTNQDPIMKVDTITLLEQDLNAHQLVAENLDILMKDKKKKHTMSPGSNRWDGNSQIYFREIVFSPEVRIRFDYHGRRVELSRGPVTGLLMGLGQLNCSEIRLKKIIYKRGLLGFDKLLTYLCEEWLRDIKKNQLPNILSGVGPTYAFIQLFQGIYDLFKLPIEQFQKDRRIIKGLQLGARSFTARTALAALEITSRIIQLLQFTAETAFDMVSTGPSVKRKGVSGGNRKRHHRPKDIREGVTNAFNIVKEGFNDSAHKFIENAVTEHDQKGYTGAVGAVMRQIPQLVVCPAVLATQATTNILGGAKSSLVPEAKWEARDKWKDDNDEH